ncbi:Hypothetical predicted protein [Paramuricea clavata]|uniref:Uncharacterized protein n=1 Tax=Paramuricea clavata TaxID=317549 RepID=A0A7D9HD84_PARCT|nr:Hypothetical predicted protein [Paramuricea clavata]
MSDAFKLHQSLIRGYEKAFLHKNGQAVQQEVAKVWREIKTNCKTRTELTVATEKQLAEWKQIELKKKGSLLSFWSKVPTQSTNKVALPENAGTETSSDKNNAPVIEVIQQPDISVDKPMPTASLKDVPAPKQQELHKELSQLKSDLVVLYGKRDMNMMTPDDYKEISKKKQMLKNMKRS